MRSLTLNARINSLLWFNINWVIYFLLVIAVIFLLLPFMYL